MKVHSRVEEEKSGKKKEGKKRERTGKERKNEARAAGSADGQSAGSKRFWIRIQKALVLLTQSKSTTLQSTQSYIPLIIYRICRSLARVWRPRCPKTEFTRYTAEVCEEAQCSCRNTQHLQESAWLWGSRRNHGHGGDAAASLTRARRTAPA